MRVTPNAIRNNWQFNFAMGAGLFLWFVLACIVLLDPKGATAFVSRMGLGKGADNMWLLATMSFMPAFMIAIPIGLIGRLKGISVARRVLEDSAADTPGNEPSPRPFSSGRRELQTDRWLASAAPAPATAPAPTAPPTHQGPPSGGGIASFLVRMVVGVLWLIVFFVVGSVSISLVVMTMTEGDQEARQRAVEAAGKAAGVPLLFGSLFVVGVLGKLGWLPGLRRRKTEPPASDLVLPASKPPDSRLAIPR
jgi:hypothetical protein